MRERDEIGLLPTRILKKASLLRCGAKFWVLRDFISAAAGPGTIRAVCVAVVPGTVYFVAGDAGRRSRASIVVLRR